MSQQKWDSYFIGICAELAKNSKCLSRQIGSLIVIDKSIVTTGYNGPPRGVEPCIPSPNGECPRRAAGYPSGEGLYKCRAAHAEVNCISNAARLGVSIKGGILYLNTVMPCKDCAAQIINAGIVAVVSLVPKFYDWLGAQLMNEAGIECRTVDGKSLFDDQTI